MAELPGAAWREPRAGARRRTRRARAARPRPAAAASRWRRTASREELEEDAATVAAALALLEVEGLAVRGEGQRFWAAPSRVPRTAPEAL